MLNIYNNKIEHLGDEINDFINKNETAYYLRLCKFKQT